MITIPFSDVKQKRVFFTFIHIPKCGGTTFHDILNRNLGHAYRNIYHGLYEDPISNYNLRLYIEESDIRLGIGGHRLSLDLPFFDCPNIDIKAISFVREPIERIRSEYFYVKLLPGNISQNEKIHQYDYSKYLEYLIKDEEARNKIGKYQLDFLFGKLQPSFNYIEKLIENNRFFLLPLDKFSQACLLLEKKFPDLIKDASFIKKNVRKEKKNKSFENLENQLRQLIINDYKLYKIANKQLSQLMTSYYNPQELEQAEKDFNRRCLRRKYIHSPIQEFFRKLYRLSSL